MNMAPFHFHATQIKCRASQSAVAFAVYQAGEKLHRVYCKEVFMYNK
jgi:hypothetical protein